MRLRRRQRVNREDFPLVYVGPDTKWGLANGTAARRQSGKARSGMVAFTAPDGRAWQVPASQLVPYELASKR